jgi:5-oxoprolinase (ATP-hydrolysing) subunit A
MASIDLNADLGEGMASDDALLEIVSSCNIACGGHAGDDASMAAGIASALRHGVVIGAHPSYPDREGFGRRSRFAGGEALYESLTCQSAAFASIAAELGARVDHLKPHGALYNDAARDPALAAIVARTAAEVPGRIALVGPPGSELERAAGRLHIPFIAEAFADRRYRSDGSLVPREEPGAVMTSSAECASQALLLAREGAVVTVDGQRIGLCADTLCLHGDTPGAVATAAAIRDALLGANVQIAAPRDRA